MIGLLFSPLFRNILVGISALMVLGGIYGKIRSDAMRQVSAQSTTDALKRTQDAIAAGDSVDVSPERLLEDDGNRRD